ncbi:Alpha-L-fucosidase [Ceratobasidium theobromae]|uniref:alpha-L-fucosidase n=1 Tax=Ceratobasidium theobromae TaxID=1582974 RepID=A0A5N5QHE6_9AGAM|nr:Alpha-L-fucosidase [Ceratobasidium theobromae]
MLSIWILALARLISSGCARDVVFTHIHPVVHDSETAGHIGTQNPILSEAFPLSQLYNNIACGPHGDFDGAGSAFPIHTLPHGEFTHDRVSFQLPEFGSAHGDNVITDGEVLKLSGPRYIREIHVLYAGDHNDGDTHSQDGYSDYLLIRRLSGETGARFQFEFEDDSKQEVDVKNWWTLHWLNVGVIKSSHHTTDHGTSVNHNVTQIHHWSASVNTRSPLRAISLPPKGSYNRFHLFALSIVYAGPLSGCVPEPSHYEQLPLALAPPSPGPRLVIRRARTTHKLHEVVDRLGNPLELGGAQLVEITLANLRPTAAGAHPRCWAGPVHLWVFSDTTYTVKHGEVHRLMPGDEVKVRVWVRNFDQVVAGSPGTMRIEVRDASGAPGEQGKALFVSDGWPMVAGVPPYDGSEQSLGKHETPLWWDDAKFGIFIHWGIYSVPAWSPKGYYAAWYQWWLHNPPGPQNILWNYHKEHYGEGCHNNAELRCSDDFIPNFTASEFNASEWIQLFSDAGAKYFVLVTKHHEGFSLFDTGNTTHRSSVYLGPRRDFIKELMDAARTEHPEMRRGTYYSLPEWFNPDAGPYGFETFPGHLARNAYNESKVEPYTGRIEGKDYLRDIQLAHMKILAHTYETEIMWCDIGGPNKTLEFAAEWYNAAAKAGREVVMNNRCGAIPDFDTPEYAKFSSTQERKWETNEGIDPVCYSYNWETKDEEYRSAEKIIHTLVDITSKNGNYLLNLGPTRTGRIIKPMIDRVLEVGRWLKHSGDCVYGTDYYFLGSDEGNLRFTRTPNTTCVIALSRPQNGTLVITKPLPIMPGDIVNLLGAPPVNGGLKWIRHHADITTILVPEEQLDAVQHAWAFQIVHL